MATSGLSEILRKNVPIGSNTNEPWRLPSNGNQCANALLHVAKHPNPSLRIPLQAG